MKVIIAGSRSLSPTPALIQSAVNASSFTITEVVSGTARGVDRAGEVWAAENSIPVRRFPADWNKYGVSAGPIRNLEMAEYANAAIVFWDGHSRGSLHMIRMMQRLSRPVHVQVVAK